MAEFSRCIPAELDEPGVELLRCPYCATEWTTADTDEPCPECGATDEPAPLCLEVVA